MLILNSLNQKNKYIVDLIKYIVLSIIKPIFTFEFA